MPTVLLTNHHLVNYGGSELVTLDLATEFQQLGWDVTVATFQLGSKVEENFKERGVKVVNILNKSLTQIEFDLIWSHHFPVLIKCLVEDAIKTKYLVISSLSPYESLETIPFFYAQADLILCNSEETKKQIIKDRNSTSVNGDEIFVFKNSVPSSWFNLNPVRENLDLKKIAVISNHPPVEILDAINILRADEKIEADLIGTPGIPRLVDVDLLRSYDAVITIGRTVQHCMALSIPVFCYDHFGGPDWLNLDNFKLAEWFNYSGRCSYQKLSSKQIVDKLINEFTESKKNVSFFKTYATNNYSLNQNINTVLNSIGILDTKKKEYLIFDSDKCIGKVGKIYCKILREKEVLQNELSNSQSQLQKAQAELANSQSQLQETQSELANSQSQLNTERDKVILMEGSKFEKSRKIWNKFKKMIEM
jgi:O-antigen biosynthesis protein